MKKLSFIEKTNYSKEEQTAICEYFVENFGVPVNQYYPEVSEGGNPGICFQVIPPTPERNFQILVSVGFGAYKLNVPGGGSLDKFSDGRSELMIFLPADFNLALKADQITVENFWPVYSMLAVIQLAIEGNGAIVAGDMVPAVFSSCGFRMKDAAALPPFFSDVEEEDDDEVEEDENDEVEEDGDDNSDSLLDEAYYCELPNGDRVEFLQLVPIYPEEFEELFVNEANFFINLYGIATECFADFSRKSFMEKS